MGGWKYIQVEGMELAKILGTKKRGLFREWIEAQCGLNLREKQK